MDFENNGPAYWAREFLRSAQWPGIVVTAYFMGRYVHSLEVRLKKAETNLTALIERHMPQIHRALADIRGLLMRRD